MTVTLANLVYKVGRTIGGGVMKEGVATGGSSTTIIDTNDRDETSNYWQDGTAIIVKDAGGAGAAPEGEYSVINSSTSSTYTVTLRSAFSSSSVCAAGDKYALIKKRYPLYNIISEINNSLMSVGPIPQYNSTSIQIDTSKTEYELPSAASLDLREVYLMTNEDDTDDNRWVKLPRSWWKIQRSATGTADVIIFSRQFDEDLYIKLVYLAPHSELVDYDDELNAMVNDSRIVYQASANLLRWYMDKTQSNDYEEQYARLSAEAAKARAMYPIPIPTKDSKILVTTLDGYVRDDTVNKVYA